MIKISQIDIEDFGPYKGQQSLRFPLEKGVTIVYGENMAGKTSLLNAIRYALYGHTMTRGAQRGNLLDAVNLEAIAEGRYGFKITLFFEHDGISYELTRVACAKDPEREPENDSDFDEQVFLRRDSVDVGPTAGDAILANVMPEQISRFFLFDGELLQTYEQLVRDESVEGPQIKESIERILGLPFLTNAREHAEELKKDAERQEGKAAARNNSTKEIGKYLNEANARRDALAADLVRMTDEKTAVESEQRSLQANIAKHERAKALLDEKDEIRVKTDELEGRVSRNLEFVRGHMTESWRWTLKDKIKNLRDAEQNEISELQSRITNIQAEKQLVGLQKKAADDGRCPTCNQSLEASVAHAILENLNEPATEICESDIDRLKYLQLRQECADKYLFDEGSTTVEAIFELIDDLTVNIIANKARMRDLTELTKDVDDRDVRQLFAELSRLSNDLSILTEGIKEQKRKVDEEEVNINKLTSEIKRIGSPTLAKDQFRRELYDQLRSLFGEAVSEYRDRLKDRVEEDATRIFLSLTSESEYSGLRINDNYGLTIVHEDGEDIPVRSAGAEHTVALSLMGALQCNASLKGPIIIDSPFGRLDEEHTANTLEALPAFSDQIVLLAFRRELPPDLARKKLGGNLKAEYAMVKKTARHTELEPLKV